MSSDLSDLGSFLSDVQTFTGTGSWTKPSWARTVRVILFGGGGGGGSGRRGAAGSARSGGTGGYCSNATETVHLASDLAATVVVTIGAAGSGGSAVSADSTSGNDGTAGGDTTFGGYQRARGGPGGRGGGAAATQAQDSAIDFPGVQPPSASSVTADVSLAVPNVTSPRGGGPGGTAGSLSTGNAEFAGQKGGYPYGDPAAAGTAKGSAGSNGSDGANSSLPGYGGAGGGAGGANPSGTGGTGGAGARGSGGGGGGASVNGSNSGAGGNGGPGYAVVISYG